MTNWKNIGMTSREKKKKVNHARLHDQSRAREQRVSAGNSIGDSSVRKEVERRRRRIPIRHNDDENGQLDFAW